MLLDGEAIGTLRTPINYFEALLSDVPALIEYLELPPNDKARLLDYFETLFNFKGSNRHMDWLHNYSRQTPPLIAYTQRIFNLLTETY